MEALALGIVVIVVALQRNWIELIIADPVPNFLIPCWILIAYWCAGFRVPAK